MAVGDQRRIYRSSNYSFILVDRFSMTGDDDNRHVEVFPGELFPQFKTIQAWKCEIRIRQLGADFLGWSTKLMCRGECLGLPVLLPDQEFQGLAHGSSSSMMNTMCTALIIRPVFTS